ncbi:hypothetical protein QVD99_004708 [Batrachochytrium dendrobatidis]|nr:hypothetical protein QVD99_004708 [Batrachochytrium dendrobatidis]
MKWIIAAVLSVMAISSHASLIPNTDSSGDSDRSGLLQKRGRMPKTYVNKPAKQPFIPIITQVSHVTRTTSTAAVASTAESSIESKPTPALKKLMDTTQKEIEDLNQEIMALIQVRQGLETKLGGYEESHSKAEERMSAIKDKLLKEPSYFSQKDLMQKFHAQGQIIKDWEDLIEAIGKKILDVLSKLESKMAMKLRLESEVRAVKLHFSV